MTTLVRWNPGREALTYRDPFGQLFEEPFGFPFPEKWGLTEFEPKIDFTEEANEYVVKASIPGVKPEDVEVTIQNNILTIKGEAKESKEVKEEKYLVRERRYGSFMRSIMMPTEVNVEEVKAKNEDGVLTIHAPKSQVAKPKKVTVHVGNGTSQ